MDSFGVNEGNDGLVIPPPKLQKKPRMEIDQLSQQLPAPEMLTQQLPSQDQLAQASQQLLSLDQLSQQHPRPPRMDELTHQLPPSGQLFVSERPAAVEEVYNPKPLTELEVKWSLWPRMNGNSYVSIFQDLEAMPSFEQQQEQLQVHHRLPQHPRPPFRYPSQVKEVKNA